MKKDENKDEIQLSLNDRQILEEIGYQAIHQTKKGLVIRDKKQLLGNIKKSQWPEHNKQ